MCCRRIGIELPICGLAHMHSSSETPPLAFKDFAENEEAGEEKGGAHGEEGAPYVPAALNQIGNGSTREQEIGRHTQPIPLLLNEALYKFGLRQEAYGAMQSISAFRGRLGSRNVPATVYGQALGYSISSHSLFNNPHMRFSIGLRSPCCRISRPSWRQTLQAGDLAEPPS